MNFSWSSFPLLGFNRDYLAPEVIEPIRRQLSVANRMLDVLMTEVCLQSAGVVAIVRIALGEALLLGGCDGPRAQMKEATISCRPYYTK